jgi:hypothetical protein
VSEYFSLIAYQASQCIVDVLGREVAVHPNIAAILSLLQLTGV